MSFAVLGGSVVSLEEAIGAGAGRGWWARVRGAAEEARRLALRFRSLRGVATEMSLRGCVERLVGQVVVAVVVDEREEDSNSRG